MDHRPVPRRLPAAALLLLVLAAFALVAIPVWLIRPFAPETPRGIAVAFWLRRAAPLATLAALLAGLVVAVRLWRGARWWSRAATTLAVVLLVAVAWVARQNIFEKMFAPLRTVGFAPATEAPWVADVDPVLAVTLGGDAAAYPVRQVAYHHVVHDVVGGVPIVATY